MWMLAHVEAYVAQQSKMLSVSIPSSEDCETDL
jgi:hypothetical protein